MDISLTKLPWYAQIGAFVALSVVGVGMFYYYYEMPARAEIASHDTTLKALKILARRKNGRKPRFQRANGSPGVPVLGRMAANECHHR